MKSFNDSNYEPSCRGIFDSINATNSRCSWKKNQRTSNEILDVYLTRFLLFCVVVVVLNRVNLVNGAASAAALFVNAAVAADGDDHLHNFTIIANAANMVTNLNRRVNVLDQADDEYQDEEYAHEHDGEEDTMSESKFELKKTHMINEYSLSDKAVKDCSNLFDNCLCSFYEETQRSFLYCNHPRVRSIPNFRLVNSLFEQHIRPTRPSANLIFSKVDFSGSSIKTIRKSDLADLKMDIFNQNSLNTSVLNIFTPKNAHLLSSVSETNASSAEAGGPKSIDRIIDELRKVVVPKYHLDFEGIDHIEDGAFEQFTRSSINLSYHLANKNGRSSERNELLLKLRFSDSKFNFSPNRKPFKGLKAKEIHISNMSSEYLANSIFDDAIVDEFYLDSAPNFVGFLDLSEHLPTGKLLSRFVVTRSYKIDSLCSHSLPSFVEYETFHEIIIKKCSNLKSIKAFTFYRYSHLRSLILTGNMFSVVHKDSFRSLNQLESLDLSSNPILHLEDETFRDLNSLKSLYLQSTNIRQLGELTLVGLHKLVELKLTKSWQLSEIHGRAFVDCRKSLRELSLKETSVKFIDVIERDDFEPPYLSVGADQTWVIFVVIIHFYVIIIFRVRLFLIC